MISEWDSLSEEIRKIRFLNTGFHIDDGVECFSGTYAAAADEELARAIARRLIPWRKGPFRLNGFLIDAEWRSDMKWDRLLPETLDLKGKTVADVGCNNGYYLYRIADAGARHVTGFDPTLKYFLQYQLIAAHAPRLPVEFQLKGWQALADYETHFDVIFLMGINYHDSEPFNIYHAVRRALKPGGLLICESVVVDRPERLNIYPPGKYAGIGGVYAIPTPAQLCADLSATGFNEVKVQHVQAMTGAEQRSAEFSPQKSLVDFVREDGWSIEGYPPLHRAAVFCRA